MQGVAEAALRRARAGVRLTRALDAGSDGYAAVDAIVALTILATTLALAVGAAASARRAAQVAVEVQGATTLLRRLVDSPVSAEEAGRVPMFDWRVSVEPMPGAWPDAAIQLCRRTAEARARRSGRRYHFASIVACPMKDAA